MYKSGREGLLLPGPCGVYTSAIGPHYQLTLRPLKPIAKRGRHGSDHACLLRGDGSEPLLSLLLNREALAPDRYDRLASRSGVRRYRVADRAITDSCAA
jgi:hypothetical protein